MKHKMKTQLEYFSESECTSISGKLEISKCCVTATN